MVSLKKEDEEDDENEVDNDKDKRDIKTEKNVMKNEPEI